MSKDNSRKIKLKGKHNCNSNREKAQYLEKNELKEKWINRSIIRKEIFKSFEVIRHKELLL